MTQHSGRPILDFKYDQTALERQWRPRKLASYCLGQGSSNEDPPPHPPAGVSRSYGCFTSQELLRAAPLQCQEAMMAPETYALPRAAQ